MEQSIPQFHAIALGEPEDILDNPFTDSLTRMSCTEGRRMFRVAGPKFPAEIITDAEELMPGMRIGWEFRKRDIHGYLQTYRIDRDA